VRHYNTYSAYLKKRFGTAVLKVPLNAGFSCPNRDGTKSSDGCAFCDNQAFSPAAKSSGPLLEQFSSAIARAPRRYGRFIAYLQPFSNTYGTLERLKAAYEPLLALPGLAGLGIGTRPDCISDEAYAYLGECAKRTCLSVELGLQTSHDETLALINRGHTFAEFVSSVQRLSSLAIETVAHVIIGLPGETADRIFETADRLAGLPVHGVKIHQLMIVRGTVMEQWFNQGRASALTLEEYAPLLCGFLERLRPDQVVHRIMSDSKTENGLVAPLWSADKKSSIKFLHDYMDEQRIKQGSKFKINK
jgi:hypothetical protein